MTLIKFFLFAVMRLNMSVVCYLLLFSYFNARESDNYFRSLVGYSMCSLRMICHPLPLSF